MQGEQLKKKNKSQVKQLKLKKIYKKKWKIAM